MLHREACRPGSGYELVAALFTAEPQAGLGKIADLGIGRVFKRQPGAARDVLCAPVGKSLVLLAQRGRDRVQCLPQTLIGSAGLAAVIVRFEDAGAVFDDCLAVREPELFAQWRYFCRGLARSQHKRNGSFAQSLERHW